MDTARLLLVCTGEPYRHGLVNCLARTEFFISEAATLPEGLKIAAEGITDLILLGSSLDGLCAHDFLKQLKASSTTSSIPVLHISHLPSGEARETLADAVLIAPFDTRTLLSLVRQMLRARRAEETLRQTIELNPQLLWSTTPEGIVVNYSDRWCRLTGLSRSEALDDGWLKVLHPEDLPRMHLAWSRSVATGEAYNVEHRIRLADGTYRWMHSRAFPHRAADGTILRWFGVSEDIQRRVEAERRFQESEERFRSLFEESMDAVFLTIPDGCIMAANPAACAMFGMTEEELRKAGRQGIINPDDPRFPAALAERAQKGRIQVELSYRRKDGTVFPAEVQSVILNGGKGHSFVVIHDISERKKAEEALCESERRLRLLGDNLPNSAIYQYLHDIDGTFRFTYVSAGIERLNGVSVETVLKEPDALHRQILPKYVEALRVAEERSIRDLSDFDMEIPMRRPDGELRWMRVRSRPRRLPNGATLWDGVQTDITAQKKAEEALYELALKYSLALEAGNLGTWDSTFGEEIFWDARARQLFGVPPDKKISQSIALSLLHPEDRASVMDAINAAANPHSDGKYHAEYRVIWPDGSVRWISSDARAHFAGEGAARKAIRFIGTVQDITDQKAFQAELERQVADRTARLQELVNELEHFSYSITHDMRAPLRAMRGIAEVLSEQDTQWPPGEQKKFIQRIIIAAERMDGLITDALQYSKMVKQELPLAPVHLGRLLEGILDTYPDFQGDHVDISIHLCRPMVMGNEAGLTQCFSNLLENAVKFVKPGSKARVRIQDELLQVSSARRVKIWVEDDGIGISESMIPRVFDMFARGSSPSAGNGIGLALVRKVVDRMGGKVGVESQEGFGCRFWVELNAADPI